jgi:rhodanese-related sulfurtransferase
MTTAIVHDISLDDLRAGLIDGSIYLVDVREANEWAAGHIAGAHFNPLSAFDPQALPPAAEGRRIVLHCRSGRRSITALELAQAAGRLDVTTHYEGGMLGWVAAGEPVVEGA